MKLKGKIIVTQGLPGSGKSTWAKNQQTLYPNTYIRVNKDELRKTLFGNDYTKDKEYIILNVIDDIIRWAISENLYVIDDNTNLNCFHVERYKKLFGDIADIVIVDNFLSVSIDECIKRDLKRENSVGKDVILKMTQSKIYKKYIEKNNVSNR